MLLGPVQGGASPTLTVEKPFSHLNVKINLSATGKTALSGASTIKEVDQFLENLNNSIVVTAAIKEKDGTQTNLFNARNLIDLMEFSQEAEGLIKLDSENSCIRGRIELTKLGAIPFNNDEEFRLILSTKVHPTYSSVEFRAMESPLTAQDVIRWHTLDVGSESQKNFDVSDYGKIMIPLSAFTNSMDLQFHYSNGKSISWNKENIYESGYLLNDIVYNLDGKLIKSGFHEYAILDVSMVRDIKMYRNSTTSFRMLVINQELLPSAEESQAQNEALKDLELDAKLIRMANGNS